MDLMVRLKELQRRIDQMIGVPKGTERERIKNTLNARLLRLEDQVSHVNTKLDECLACLRSLPQLKIPDLKPIEN
jgi:hypothetical protein